MKNNNLDTYKLRFKAHDSSGVAAGLGEEFLMRIGPLLDPLLNLINPVIGRLEKKQKDKLEKKVDMSRKT